jgi:hypothetical protein
MHAISPPLLAALILIPLIATSVVVQGLMTTVIPLAAFLGVLIWYLISLRRRYPD